MRESRDTTATFVLPLSVWIALSGGDPAAGAPITVTRNRLTTGIDFHLEAALVFTDGFESGDLSAWSAASGD